MDICTIEHLPPEILELIFQELSLKDISNCAQTCQHWNYCIEAFFRNQGMYYLPTKSPYCLEIHFFLCCYLLAKKTQSFYFSLKSFFRQNNCMHRGFSFW